MNINDYINKCAEYRLKTRERSLSERVGRGLTHTGLPSAALTAAFNFGKPGMGRSALLMGGIGTVAGTILSRKKAFTLEKVSATKDK